MMELVNKILGHPSVAESWPLMICLVVLFWLAKAALNWSAPSKIKDKTEALSALWDFQKKIEENPGKLTEARGQIESFIESHVKKLAQPHRDLSEIALNFSKGPLTRFAVWIAGWVAIGLGWAYVVGGIVCLILGSGLCLWGLIGPFFSMAPPATNLPLAVALLVMSSCINFGISIHRWGGKTLEGLKQKS